MEALYLLIPLSILVVFAAIWLFFRMSDGGQFDDMAGPAFRILQDDDGGRPAGQTAATAPTASETAIAEQVAAATNVAAITASEGAVEKKLPGPAQGAGGGHAERG